ncbi:MAG: Ig-like domain-containing protein [Gemmatimonadota bacterium]
MRFRRVGLLLLGLALAVQGCSRTDSGTNPPTETPVATSIDLSAVGVALVSIGATSQLTATVRDQNGAAMSGQVVAWSSAAPSVATVSNTGLVTSVGNGSTTVTAAVGSVTADAAITVEQVAASVAPSTDTLTLAGPAEQGTLTASVLDALGSVLAGATVSWSIDDTGVATIDGGGMVTAVAPGTTTATAALTPEPSSGPVTGDVVVVVNSLAMGVNDFCGDFAPDAEPAFAADALEEAVRGKLGIGPADTMTCAMLATVDSLFVLPVPGSLITNLAGAQNLVGLDSLWVAAHGFSDLAPLGELPELDYLNVANGNVDDAGLAGIGSSPALTHLDVSSNDDVSDVSSLSTLSTLDFLHVGSTDVSNLTPLSGLTSLTYLNVFQTPVSDLSPISGLTGLETLVASRSSVSNLSPIATLTALRALYFGDTAVSDVSPLSGLTNLELVWMQRSSAITSIASLSTLTSLVELDVSQLGLTSLAGVEGMASLEDLDAHDNPISDISALSGRTTIRILDLLAMGPGFSDISVLETLTGLEVLNLGSNSSLSDIQPLISNVGLGAGDEVTLTLTSVNCTNANLLRANGVEVALPGCPPP